MKMKIKRQVEAKGETSDLTPGLLVYCSHCGSIADYVFQIGQFVFVGLPGIRPYFGKIIKIYSDGGQATGIVARNNHETEKVNLQYVKPV